MACTITFTAVLLLALCSCAAASTGDHHHDTSGNNPNLKFMMTYDFDLSTQHDWLTVISGDGASPAEMVKAHNTYQSIQGMPILPATVFDRAHRSLYPDWEEETDKFVALISPGVSNGTFAGVFTGDEICCSGTPLSNLTSVANVLRKKLPASAVIYTNECEEMQTWSEIPEALNYVSIDFYDEHNTNGSAEVAKNKQFYNEYIFPKLKPHQGVLLVPGIFASDPVHCKASNVSCPLDLQSEQIVIKLKEMFEWAQSDSRIYGFNPWHYSNRSTPQLAGAYDQRLGAISMPTVADELRKIGQYIRGVAQKKN